MAIYLKWFKTDSEYNTYTADTENFIIPNVSFVENSSSKKVRFTPSSNVPPTPPTPPTPVEIKLTCKYIGLKSSGSGSGSGSGAPVPTHLFGSRDFKDSIESMEIDGIEQEEIIDEKLFDDEDEHTVVYTMKDSVTSIGDSAFDGCDSLTSIDIPSGVTSIGNRAFADCNGLTSCTIGSGVTSIGISAFGDCTGLTSIVIPNSVTSIGDSAFDGCDSLTSIVISSGVTSIGANAFAYCSGLTSVTIPDSVTSIGQSAFGDCTSLTSITIEATTPPTLGTYVFDATNNCPIYVPSASVGTYKSASGWSSYASRIQAIS